MDRNDLMALYDRLIEPHSEIERKGKKMPYTAVNGNMFSFVDPADQLCIRLSDEDRAEWADLWSDAPVLQYGSVIKGYVSVPDELVADEPTLVSWFARSVKSARALKPKPTKKK